MVEAITHSLVELVKAFEETVSEYLEREKIINVKHYNY